MLDDREEGDARARFAITPEQDPVFNLREAVNQATPDA
jgi:hypothetical protein